MNRPGNVFRELQKNLNKERKKNHEINNTELINQSAQVIERRGKCCGRSLQYCQFCGCWDW